MDEGVSGSTIGGITSKPAPNALADVIITVVLTLVVSGVLTLVDMRLSQFRCPGYNFGVFPSSANAASLRILPSFLLSLFVTSVLLFALWKVRHPGIPSYRTAAIKFSGLSLPVSALILVNTIAVGNTCVSSEGVFIRAHPWNEVVRSGWQDVRSIKIACYQTKHSGDLYFYTLNMKSGRQVTAGIVEAFEKNAKFNVPVFSRIAQLHGLSMPAVPKLTECAL